MTWLSQRIIDDLDAAAAAYDSAVEKAGDALETHRKAAFAARDELHRHQGLAAEAKFLLSIAHGAAPVPPPGQIREVDDEHDGLGLAIGNLRIALPPDASPEQFGRLAESMRALYAAAHVVALHADDRVRTGFAGPPPGDVVSVRAVAHAENGDESPRPSAGLVSLVREGGPVTPDPDRAPEAAR